MKENKTESNIKNTKKERKKEKQRTVDVYLETTTEVHRLPLKM